MDPRIGLSVAYTSPDRWNMGNLWFCEKVSGPTPTDAVATWEDGDSTFALRPQPENSPPLEGDSDTNRFCETGSRLAIWYIGENVICKVASWIEGLELEADTIRAVKDQMPSIPVPEVIYSWIDHAWNRSYLLYKRPSGEKLRHAWGKLSPAQIEKVAADLAQHAVTMAQFTSPELKTITGCGVDGENFLLSQPDGHIWPSWKPVIRPLFTPETLTTYLRDLGGEDPPDIGDRFHFYHPVMCPIAVHVSVSGPEAKDVQITAITDWEEVAYYPHWWIALKPRVSHAFALGNAQTPGLWVSNQILSDAMRARSFDCPVHWYMRAREYRLEQRDQRRNERKLI